MTVIDRANAKIEEERKGMSKTYMNDSLGDTLNKDCQEIVSRWMRIVDFKMVGIEKYKMCDKKIGPSKALQVMLTDYARAWTEKSMTVKKLAKKQEAELKREFDRALDDMIGGFVKETANKVKFNNSSHVNLISFLELLLQRPATELEVAVLSHSLWQVKRKLNGLPVSNHIWLNIYSKQNTGKSNWFKTLFKPVSGIVWNSDIGQLVDERNVSSFQSHFISFNDELAKAETKKDSETLKKVITGDEATFRPLFTNRKEEVVNNLTFFSASNVRISDALGDPTGMRRFFEIDNLAPRNPRKVVSEMFAMSEHDILSIWRSIDEGRDDGYVCDIMEELEEKQIELIPETPLDRWFNDTQLKGWMSCADVLASVQEYFRTKEGIDRVTQASIGRFLRGKGLSSEVCRCDNEGKSVPTRGYTF